MEEWKDVIGYEGLYRISSYGRVKSIKNGKDRILKLCLSGGKYYYVMMHKNKNEKKQVIHRLIAKAFLENPLNLPQVNHIDGNKLNNNVDNLQWVTASQNSQHAYDMGLHSNKLLNKEQLNQLIEMKEDGKLNKEIADKFSLTITQVNSLVVRYRKIFIYTLIEDGRVVVSTTNPKVIEKYSFDKGKEYKVYLFYKDELYNIEKYNHNKSSFDNNINPNLK